MNMWLASSPDLLHWGDHRFVMGIRQGQWDGGRIGAGTVPIRTECGWLEIYHGATTADRYCPGAILFDAEQPNRVIARMEEPLLQPEAGYQQHGFMPDVEFTSGAVLSGDTLTIYYGAADEVMAGAEISLTAMLERLLEPVREAA